MHDTYRGLAGARQRADVSALCEAWADFSRYVVASRGTKTVTADKGKPPPDGAG